MGILGAMDLIRSSNMPRRALILSRYRVAMVTYRSAGGSERLILKTGGFEPRRRRSGDSGESMMGAWCQCLERGGFVDGDFQGC